MATIREVYNHNRKVATAFKTYIRLMPKVVALYAADAALAGVMRPAGRNFPLAENGRATVSGSLMPHNSSNAAWNWRITFEGEDSPIYDKGKSPVGDSYEYRSNLNMPEMYGVISRRRELDVNRKLYGKLFSSVNAPMPKFKIYNNIDKLGFGQTYVERSNVEAASAELKSYATGGAIMSYGLLKEFMRSGTKGIPSPDALLKSLKTSQGTHFASESKG